MLAVFRQLSTHGQKFDRKSLYEPVKFETLNEPIFGQQILILDPPLVTIKLTYLKKLTLDFLVRL